MGNNEMLDENKIADERMSIIPHLADPDAREKCHTGQAIRAWWKIDQTHLHCGTGFTLGVAGYQAGPNKHVIDRLVWWILSWCICINRSEPMADCHISMSSLMAI